MWQQIGQGVLAAVLTGAVYAGLRWAFPPRESKTVEVSDALRAELRWPLLWATFGMLLLGFGATVPWAMALRAIARAAAARPGDALVVVGSWIFFVLPSMFLGLVSGGIVVDRIARWRLGPDRYAALDHLMNTSQGYDARRLMVPLLTGIAVFTLGMLWLLSAWHVRLTATHLVIGYPFADDPAPVPYARIQAVQVVRRARGHKGEFVPQLRIVWGEGQTERWSSKNLLNGIDKAWIERLATEVAARAKRPVERTRSTDLKPPR